MLLDGIKRVVVSGLAYPAERATLNALAEAEERFSGSWLIEVDGLFETEAEEAEFVLWLERLKKSGLSVELEEDGWEWIEVEPAEEEAGWEWVERNVA